MGRPSSGGSTLCNILVSLLSLALIAIVAVFIYREMGTREDESSSTTIINSTSCNTGDIKLTGDNVQNYYPGLFRTKNEQTYFERMYYTRFYSNRKVVNRTIDVENRNCTFQCVKPARKKRQVSTIQHGCCVSGVFFEAPVTKLNVNGVLRIFVQFENSNQYFPVHWCSSINGCNACTCSQEGNIFVGVVWKDDDDDDEPEELEDTELDFFEFDGCCKCLNF